MIAGVPVYCLGAEKASQVAKIQGSSVKYCYGDEIAKWNKDVFTMLQSRLDKSYSVMDGALNPESPNHWLKAFMDKPDIDCYVQKYTIFDNPFLPQSYVENLCKEYEGTVFYGRYIQGEWTLAEGLIYPNYQKCIAEPPQDEKPTAYVLSIDYGTMNAFSCGLWGKYGAIWYRIDEYYYSGRDTGIQKTDGEYLEDILRLVDKYPIKDTCNKITTIIDPSAASMIALLKRNGRFHVKEADNAVMDGIRETNTAMVDGLIKVSPKCKNWLKEVQGYVWDEKSAEDKPVKVADHAMDESRYLVKTMKLTKPKKQYNSLYLR
jgi:PBSX family phage terminase large subunit